MLRIGEFAQLLGVTTRALRHYDAIGLVSPTTADDRTGYRYYGVAQIARAQHVLALRGIGIPLSTIRVALGADNSARATRALLERQRESIERAIGMLTVRLRLLDEDLEETLHHPFVLKRTPPQWALSRRARVRTYEDADTLIQSLAANQIHGLRGRPAAIWHDCRPQEGHIDCEALRLFDAPSPSGATSFRRLSGQLVVSFVHTGPDTDLPRLYLEMRRWCERSDIRVSGPLTEVYWPGLDGSPVVELRYPVVSDAAAVTPPFIKLPRQDSNLRPGD